MSVCFLFYCTCRLLPSWWINVYIIWLHEEFIGQQFTPKPQTRNQRGTWMNVTPNAVQKISRPGRKRSAIFLFQTVSRHNVFIFYHSCHPLWKNFDQAPVKIDVEEPAIATWMYLKAALQVKHIDGWSGFVGFETPPPCLLWLYKTAVRNTKLTKYRLAFFTLQRCSVVCRNHQILEVPVSRTPD